MQTEWPTSTFPKRKLFTILTLRTNGLRHDVAREKVEMESIELPRCTERYRVRVDVLYLTLLYFTIIIYL